MFKIRLLIVCALILALSVTLFAAIEMKAIYPPGFYDNDHLLVENGLMVTLQALDATYGTMNVYNAEDPASPVLLSTQNVIYKAPHDARLYHGHVYIPDLWGHRLRRYSLLDPANPVLNYEYAVNQVGYRDLAFSGNYMLMSTQGLGLRITNIAPESHASEVGSFSDGNPLYRVWAKGNRAAVLSYNMDSEIAVLKIIDISVPSAPSYAGEIEMPNYSYNDDIEVAFYQDYLHLIRPYSNTMVYSLSIPGIPMWVGDLEYGTNQTVFVNDVRYSVNNGTFRIQNLPEPLEPVEIAAFDTPPWNYQSLVIDFPYAYLIGSYVFCLELSDLEPAEDIVYSYDTGVSTSTLAGWQNWLYFRGGAAQLVTPGIIADTLGLPDLMGMHILKAGRGLLQGIDYNSSLCSLWSLGDPGEPQFQSTIPGSTRETTVGGNFLFVRSAGAIRAYDISDPLNPLYLFTINGQFSSFACVGNVLWATRFDALLTYSLDDPAMPSLESNISLEEFPRVFNPALACHGDYLYLTGFQNEIRVYYVADPLNPLYVGSTPLLMPYDAAELPPYVTPEGNLAVCTGFSNQVILYDLEEPYAPEYIEHVSLPYKIHNLYCFEGRYFFKRENMIHATQMPDPVASSDPVQVPAPRLSAHPNPFTGRSSILVDTGRAHQSSELTIYNLRGQKVRDLHSGILPAGTTEFTWDGLDERGISCSQGIYLVRFKAQGCPAVVRRITLLKP